MTSFWADWSAYHALLPHTGGFWMAVGLYKQGGHHKESSQRVMGKLGMAVTMGLIGGVRSSIRLPPSWAPTLARRSATCSMRACCRSA